MEEPNTIEAWIIFSISVGRSVHSSVRLSVRPSARPSVSFFFFFLSVFFFCVTSSKLYHQQKVSYDFFHAIYDDDSIVDDISKHLRRQGCNRFNDSQCFHFPALMLAPSSKTFQLKPTFSTEYSVKY